MDETSVKARLLEVLQTIQKISGEDCPPLDDDIRPAESLPKFTSKVWPVAAGMLGIALGKSIPCEANIFVDDETKQPLSISETVALVCKILKDLDAGQAAVAAE